MADRWEDYFQPGETLLWEGAPLPGIHGGWKLIGLALFGLPFLAFGIGALGMGLAMMVGPTWADLGLGLFVAAFSIPFTAIGGYLVFGQTIVQAQAHRRVRYAVSSRAAYIGKSWFTPSLSIYPILKSSPLGLEKGRSADTVWFHVHVEKDSDGDRNTTRIGFDHIAEGEKVLHLLRSIQTGTA